ncbi:hypothetical protein RSOL_491120 [Rhizoctonia solani AG-3 Rhs1AP]|uniref:Uncharacterized protein n=1 Tax=Rhizoctonia solani AG-3 Rhs1AP TaxID=1086054 RepID=X8JI71_9AGAM|nr:hypothetical protein RSOL_491120 [Rhizoctonia solani AG-3 Rhs1AP]
MRLVLEQFNNHTHYLCPTRHLGIPNPAHTQSSENDGHTMRSLRSIASISSFVIPASVAVPNSAVSEIDSGSCVPRSSRFSVAGSMPNTVSSMNRNGSRTVRCCCSPSAGCATPKPPSPCPNPPFIPFRSTKPKPPFAATPK